MNSFTSKIATYALSAMRQCLNYIITLRGTWLGSVFVMRTSEIHFTAPHGLVRRHDSIGPLDLVWQPLSHSPIPSVPFFPLTCFEHYIIESVDYSILIVTAAGNSLSKTPLVRFIYLGRYYYSETNLSFTFESPILQKMPHTNPSNPERLTPKPDYPPSFIPTSPYSDLEEGETEEKYVFEIGGLQQPSTRGDVPKSKPQEWTPLIVRKLLLLIGFACAFVAGVMWNTPEWAITMVAPLDS